MRERECGSSLPCWCRVVRVETKVRWTGCWVTSSATKIDRECKSRVASYLGVAKHNCRGQYWLTRACGECVGSWLPAQQGGRTWWWVAGRAAVKDNVGEDKRASSVFVAGLLRNGSTDACFQSGGTIHTKQTSQ